METLKDLTSLGVLLGVVFGAFGGQADGTISTTVDYGIIQKVSYGAPDTTVTFQVPEGCTIPTSGGVASVSYSQYKSPYGFPGQESKWHVESIHKTLITQSTPTAGTWYNVGAVSISAPLGAWNWKNKTFVSSIKNSNSSSVIKTTMSTGASSETITRYTTFNFVTMLVAATHDATFSNYMSEPLETTAQTSYYHNLMTSEASAGSISTRGENGDLIIRLVNAYL